LRERKDDIPILVQHFLTTLGAEASQLPEGAVARFVEHPWPGNCRELKNAVERAVVLGEMRFLGSSQEGSAISATSSSSSSSSSAAAADAPAGSFKIDATLPYKDQKSSVIADFEERYVRLLMKVHQGNVSAASRVAGIDRMSLHKILDRYGLDARDLAKPPA
jgi:DNA-binding NtrC family response regulator